MSICVNSLFVKREALLVINDFIQHPASGIKHPASGFLFLFVNIRCIINAVNKCNTNGKKPFPAGERFSGWEKAVFVGFSGVSGRVCWLKIHP